MSNGLNDFQNAISFVVMEKNVKNRLRLIILLIGFDALLKSIKL